MTSQEIRSLEDKLCRFLRCGPDVCWVCELEDGRISVGALRRAEFGYQDYNGYGEDFDQAYGDLRAKMRAAR